MNFNVYELYGLFGCQLDFVRLATAIVGLQMHFFFCFGQFGFVL